MSVPVLTPLHKRNALMVAVQIAPILETYGLYDLEYERPKYGDHQKVRPGTLVWRARRIWTTRKTKVIKGIWYVVVHYPRDEFYETLTDEQYGLQVVYELDRMLYSEAFEATDRKKEFTDKRRHLRRMELKQNEEAKRQAALAVPEPPKIDTSEWESF